MVCLVVICIAVLVLYVAAAHSNLLQGTFFFYTYSSFPASLPVHLFLTVHSGVV